MKCDRERERASEVPWLGLVTSLLPPFFFFSCPYKESRARIKLPSKATRTRRVGERQARGGTRPCPPAAGRPPAGNGAAPAHLHRPDGNRAPPPRCAAPHSPRKFSPSSTVPEPLCNPSRCAAPRGHG